MHSRKLFSVIALAGIACFAMVFYSVNQNADVSSMDELVNVDEHYAPEHDSSKNWDPVLLKNLPCYSKNLPLPNFNKNERCWTKMKELNEQQAKSISPDTALCLFQPVSGPSYKRHDKKTVFLGIGVHIGHASAMKFEFSSCGDAEYISWERRHHNFGNLAGDLMATYDGGRLARMQNEFWNRYKDNDQLKRADVIVCGFDAWHCLIFAPFNKKMIINSGYRFDGHLPVSKEQALEQQKIYYDALRYNPDVILAGNIIYDVMYEQHFFGSHKLIPLPATGDYVVERLNEEKKLNKCPDAPKDTAGYHPKKPVIISVSPARLSTGGKKIADEILQHFKKHPIENIVFQVVERDMRKPYNYCDLGQYTAFIVLGYSVMSYFSLETAALGIPMFAPSPKLYAEFEKNNHLIPERKCVLHQASYDWMSENPRSLNKGYNPNNDYNVTATQRWVGYSSYFYYKGSVPFDDYDDLRKKILEADFKKMHQAHVKGTVMNAMRVFENVKAIDRYFHGYDDDVISSATPVHPGSKEEGMKTFDDAKSRPKFDGSKVEAKKENTWVLIDYDSYKEDVSELPDCKAVADTTIVFYIKSNPHKVDNKSGCYLLSLEEMNKALPDVFKAKKPRWRQRYYDLVAAIYATQNGATAVIKLIKSNILDLPAVDSKLKSLFGTSSKLGFFFGNAVDGWKQQIFKSNQLWLVWTPTPTQISSLYYKTLDKFTDSYQFSEWVGTSPSEKVFVKNDVAMLEDYLDNWTTDERENFFHVVDQLNFELAVKGYFSKSNAILHRLWMLHLSTLKFKVLPKLKI